MADLVVNRTSVRDWDLDVSSLEKLGDLIRKKTGLSLSKCKYGDLKNTLSQLMELFSFESFDHFYAMLHSSSPQADLMVSRLVSFFTTGETYFFRIPSHFKVIKEVVIPEIVKRRGEDKKMRIWSAGCSTGEEPYSLAILLAEILIELPDWDISILGTDIDREALVKAQRGVYRRWSFREVPMQVIRRNFIHRDDTYIIKKKFRKMVTFQPLNLVEDVYPSFFPNTTEIDLILCRNVTIYFAAEVIKQVVSKFYQSLVKGGYLLVSPAECSVEIYSDFITRVLPEVIVYQKKDRDLPSRFTTENTLSLLTNICLRESDSVKIPHPLPLSLDPVQRQKEHLNEQREVGKEETEIFREAVQFLERGEFSHSIGKFMEILKINPHNARAYFLLGRISAQQGTIADAIRCLEKSLVEDPLLLESYYLLALLRLEEGDVDEAITLFRKIIYIDPHFALAYYHLGTIYKNQGKTAWARKMFHNVKELLTGRNLNDKIIEGEDISVGQILNVAEKEITLLGKNPRNLF